MSPSFTKCIACNVVAIRGDKPDTANVVVANVIADDGTVTGMIEVYADIAVGDDVAGDGVVVGIYRDTMGGIAGSVDSVVCNNIII